MYIVHLENNKFHPLLLLLLLLMCGLGLFDSRVMRAFANHQQGGYLNL